jgi:hypothetical protein
LEGPGIGEAQVRLLPNSLHVAEYKDELDNSAENEKKSSKEIWNWQSNALNNDVIYVICGLRRAYILHSQFLYIICHTRTNMRPERFVQPHIFSSYKWPLCARRFLHIHNPSAGLEASNAFSLSTPPCPSTTLLSSPQVIILEVHAFEIETATKYC